MIGFHNLIKCESVHYEAVSDSEISIVLNDLVEKFGYDFTDYSSASVKRRINRLYSLDKFGNFNEFRSRILDDDKYLSRFVEEITVNVTEMFHDQVL